MGTGKRLRLAIVGGVFGAIVGPLVGVLLMAPMSRMPMALYLAVVRSWLVPLFIFAVPFGFIVGFIGSWWLAARASSMVSARRLYCESAGIGALLGATFPLVDGFRPNIYAIAELPFSIGSGIISGVALAVLMRSYLHCSSRGEDLRKKSSPQDASRINRD